jgi:hypothetical protein
MNLYFWWIRVGLRLGILAVKASRQRSPVLATDHVATWPLISPGSCPRQDLGLLRLFDKNRLRHASKTSRQRVCKEEQKLSDCKMQQGRLITHANRSPTQSFESLARTMAKVGHE